MAKKDTEPTSVANEPGAEIENIKRRLEMLDQRLDNIDSAISAVVERVMNQAVTLNITCPKCGKNIEIAVIGTHRLTLK